MLEKFRSDLTVILERKHNEVKTLIVAAINNKVHVVILVNSEFQKQYAWGYFQNLGFPKGESDLTHVSSSLEREVNPHYLYVHFDNICIK